jgi:hypothetical protein
MEFLIEQSEKNKREIEKANFDNEHSWEWKVPDDLVEKWNTFSNDVNM